MHCKSRFQESTTVQRLKFSIRGFLLQVILLLINLKGGRRCMAETPMQSRLKTLDKELKRKIMQSQSILWWPMLLVWHSTANCTSLWRKGESQVTFFVFVLLQKQFLLYGLNVFYAVINRCIQEKLCPPERLLQVYKMNKNFDVTFFKLSKS